MERKRLEEIAAKHKAEADQWKKNHAEEQKEREKARTNGRLDETFRNNMEIKYEENRKRRKS